MEEDENQINVCDRENAVMVEKNYELSPVGNAILSK
jgi:hypothetical protein